MDQINQNLKQSEKTVAFLTQQLAILKELANKKQQAMEEEEIKRISAENETLRKDILKLKQDLGFYEVQNGVAQVPLPKAPVVIQDALPAKQEKASNTSDAVDEKPVQTASKKEKKKDSKKKEKSGGKTKGNEESKPVDASRLNMKIGKIVNVKKHEESDKLFLEEVDVGEGKNRTIVSGLVDHYKLEQMQNRTAIFLCNLKPRKLCGVLSEGMIMCASSPAKVEILEVPEGVAIGDRVTCEGYPGEPDDQLNPKKKILEQVLPDLRVGADGVARYKDGCFTVAGKGVCKAPTMKECAIK